MICFEGNFSNLGTDILHAPSSLANNPTQLAETLGGVGLLAGGALGLGLLGADAAGAGVAGATAADAAAGGATAADLGAGAATAADLGAGTAAADLGAGAVAADAGAGAATDALALAPGTTDALAFAPAVTTADPFAGIDLSGGTGLMGFGGDTATTAAAPTFASTDAELSGGITGTAPAGTAGGTAAAASPSLTSQLGSALSSPWTKLALGVAPLGVALAMGQQGLPGQVGPAQANAAALASAGSNLNPAQTASLQQMRQDAVNAARQALFNQGVQNPEADTRWAQMTANIDSQVTAAAQTMIQQNIQNSLAGDAQLIQIAQLQMQSDQNFANNLLNATKALGTAAGLGGGTITLKAA